VLNARHHEESLRRLAEFEADILAVGHGEPVMADGVVRLRSLLE